VSPRVVPRVSTVGSPTPAVVAPEGRSRPEVSVTKAGKRGGRPPGEPGRSSVLARSPMSARRSLV
jgi:hypothetical protein